MNHLPEAYYRTLPDSTQTLLLKACLSENTEESLHHWNNWIHKNHYSRPKFIRTGHLLPQVFDNLDFGSQRLLSLLYKKMSLAKVDDPLIAELKGYYRYVWVRNQVFRNQLEEIVKLLAAGQVTYVIIKGIPAIEMFYKDWGIRSVLDIDLAIHPKDWIKSIAILKNNGWENQNRSKNPELILGGIVHSHTFIKNGYELDLHIKFLQLPFNEITENRFWFETRYYKQFHTMLKPEHQLLCSFAHGIQGKDDATRTVADTTYIIRNHEIDWNEVITVAKNSNLIIPLIVFTEYLNQEKFVIINESIMNRIYSQPITSLQFNYFELVTKSSYPNGFNQLKLKFLRASVISSSLPDLLKILSSNYKFEWGASSVPKFLFAFAWVGFNKLLFPKRKIDNRKIPFISNPTS